LWQFNEVHHTKRWDGDGQGLDSDLLLQGTAVFQYNYSHDNEGGFFLDCVNPDGGQTVVRYNLSKNDGNLGDFRRENALVYNNIFYAPDKTLASDFGGRSGAGNIFDNNIFWCAGLTGGNKQVFSHNSYFGGVTPKPGDDHAITSDPKFVNPTSAEGTTGFQLRTDSPCLKAGLMIKNNGGKDLWGNPVSETTVPNIGCYDGSGVISGQQPSIAPKSRPARANTKPPVR
jgi:hypothetical protein